MPTSYKVLGQVAASANTTHNVYTVPAATQAVLSTIVITNRSATTNSTYRIAVQPGGAALSNTHFIAYDAPVAFLDSVALTIGVTMGATDVLSVNTSTDTVSFSVFGSEITS